MMKHIFGLFLMIVATTPSVSSQTIVPILTKRNALVLEVDTAQRIRMLYFGSKLSNGDGYTQLGKLYKQGTDYTGVSDAAYSSSGSRNLFEPAISVTHADGNNSLDLRYVKREEKKLDASVSQTIITLKDPVYDFVVKLFYQTCFNEDVVEQWVEIQNGEEGNVVLRKFASANLYLRGEAFFLKQFFGDWAMEMQTEETKITHGIKTLDSKLGTRAHLFQPPSFMVSLHEPAGEDRGSVLYGSLEWSGNFRIDLELDNLNNLRLLAGINNFDSDYTLEPGETFTTPKFLFLLSNEGKGAASRRLHDWARNYKIVDGKGSRLTLLNNWEATYFDFNEKKLKALLADTKKLGVDLFLLDDGWFGNKYPRNGDNAGLGDWAANRKKLPNGISSLVKESGKNDVKFGIWIEPEMVNPSSERYEKHPDWVIKQPNRDEYYFRNQLVLDLSNPEVQDFVFGVVDDLFTENPELAYIKWDCNAVIYNARSAHLTNQSHLYINYVEGLYAVLKRIRDKYPTVPMMLCSGGGGRVDYGALQYFTEFWPSDNTDPMERIFMQWEYSYFFPAISSSNHVTDWGKQPIKFRTDVALMGKPGFDIVIDHLNEKDLVFCQNAVKTFNSIKHIIWQGDQFRLQNPLGNDVASILYMDKEKKEGVVFNYLVNNRYAAGSKLPIQLKGLDEKKRYRVTEINVYPGMQGLEETVYSGEFLMKIGLNPDVRSGRNSVVLKVVAE